MGLAESAGLADYSVAACCFVLFSKGIISVSHNRKVMHFTQ